MALQQRIKKDLMAAMKAKDAETTAALRVVMGEFGRMPSKSLADGEVVRILKKLIKSEKEVIERQGSTGASHFIAVLEPYLPQTVSEAEIEAWIRDNIDFGRYKNKMQAMGEIMRHFGEGADGNQVKSILQSRF
ncbi:MAG: GatB/YqeY domain-containing protein [Desulfobacterales bacterium]|nr:GatB/YqeY domain-containing protein [Desulfobacterales bacterium]MDJ0857289.1 GatB/YqeY domain-containing protein [Desulfobacterales bacterium]MDJ0990867.1 GatB/YqeY domain-containing protein [Desulfobacterales bacterium]